jgi:hypothetical protein
MTYPDNPTAWIERLRECWTHQSVFEEEPWNWRPPRKPRQRRKPTLAGIIRKARELCVDVVVAPDGSLILKCSAPTTTESAAGNGASDNPWDEVLPHAAH